MMPTSLKIAILSLMFLMSAFVRADEVDSSGAGNGGGLLPQWLQRRSLVILEALEHKDNEGLLSAEELAEMKAMILAGVSVDDTDPKEIEEGRFTHPEGSPISRGKFLDMSGKPVDARVVKDNKTKDWVIQLYRQRWEDKISSETDYHYLADTVFHELLRLAYFKKLMKRDDDNGIISSKLRIPRELNARFSEEARQVGSCLDSRAGIPIVYQFFKLANYISCSLEELERGEALLGAHIRAFAKQLDPKSGDANLTPFREIAIAKASLALIQRDLHWRNEKKPEPELLDRTRSGCLTKGHEIFQATAMHNYSNCTFAELRGLIPLLRAETKKFSVEFDSTEDTQEIFRAGVNIASAKATLSLILSEGYRRGAMLTYPGKVSSCLQHAAKTTILSQMFTMASYGACHDKELDQMLPDLIKDIGYYGLGYAYAYAPNGAGKQTDAIPNANLRLGLAKSALFLVQDEMMRRRAVVPK